MGTSATPNPRCRVAIAGVGRIMMKRELLINVGQRETRVAILEDEKLVELLVDRPDNRRMIGDIYLGKVEAVLPGIQAAFVDIGTEKSAFLHASDLVRESAEEAEDDEDDEDSDNDNANGNGGAPASRNGAENLPAAVHQSRRGRQAPPVQHGIKRGQEIMVQISKEPISTKGPRVTA